MRVGPLGNLVAAARSLPGEPAPAEREPLALVPAAGAPDPERAEAGVPAVPGVAIDPRELRRGIAALVATLARRFETALPEALAHADRAWDQIDSVTFLDAAWVRDADLLRGRAEAMWRAGDAATRAAGREAQLFLDETLKLARLFERRLAALVRLRLRAGEPLLDGDGRPFLDVAAALAAAGKAWA